VTLLFLYILLEGLLISKDLEDRRVEAEDSETRELLPSLDFPSRFSEFRKRLVVRSFMMIWKCDLCREGMIMQ
jgi:hypothetical protein